jgi:CubicO group peptidase (beta-lactamase class C family)
MVGAFTLLSSTTVRAQDRGVLPIMDNVAEAMTRFVDEGEVAGVVSLVANEKGILHQHVVGSGDLANKQPLSHDSIFWIASMSKPITGACVMLLVDEGKLSLDDPISKHLPMMSDLKLPDGKPATITVRHLLTHTSGMAELKPDETYTARSLEEAATRYAKVAVLFEPGSKWQYSQTSINVAARIVEVVSGMSFDEFLQKRLCAPLGMNDTVFYLSETQMKRLSKSYAKSQEGKLEETHISLLAGRAPTDRDRMPAANGGLFSTASDYAKFCQMLLRGGQGEKGRILTESAVTTLRTIATGDLVPGFTPGNGWGIGVCVVREPTGVTQMLSPGTFGHGGAYGTQAWIDPVKQRIFILMIQRAKLPNSDASDLRKTFQTEVCKVLEGSS